MWIEGGKYGSIDPCYPSKVAQAHVHNLLFKHHSEEKPLHYVYFPIIVNLDPVLENVMDTTTCPIVAGAPEVMKAAFTKEVDFFAVRGIKYVDAVASFTEKFLLKRQMFAAWGSELEVTEDESDFAVDQGLAAMRAFDLDVQSKGREILEHVEAEDKIAILLIGRPYHSDPGLNHGILEEFQILGYPVLSMRSLPKDPEWLQRFFREDLDKGRMKTPLDITDVWPENYSANSAQKVWSAKFAARHPNVAVVDLSSFKCGHDAPTYGIIDGIIRESGTPYSALHDVDANKPGGSIKIRVKTYAHSLGLHKERLEDLRDKKQELAYRIDQKRLQLLEMKKQHARDLQPLDEEIASVRARISSYESRSTPVTTPEPEPGAPKLVQLRLKKDGASAGTSITSSTTTTTTTTAAASSAGA
jgi:predicted nucleotide-binding protein (sugar kinase/HSP70/actin superfamily)